MLETVEAPDIFLDFCEKSDSKTSAVLLVQYFFSAHWQTSHRFISLSPVTTARAQRSIIRSSSVDNITSPIPRFLLRYWHTAARVTPSRFAASLWLSPALRTSLDTISARIGGKRFLTIVSQCMSVQVCFVIRTQAGLQEWDWVCSGR